MNTFPALQATSVNELLNQLVDPGNDLATRRAILGALALLLGTIIRKGQGDLLRAALREIAQVAEVSEAKWILTQSRQGLSSEQEQWLKDRLQQIRDGAEVV